MTVSHPHPSWLIDLPTCPSTSTWALEQLDALAHGACVWTTRQTAGRGQNGATWYAPPGVLTASFVLEVPSSVPVTQLALCAGLAVAHAVEDLAPKTSIAPAAPVARVELKWPNDCLLGGRKLAGVLCERPTGGGGRAVVVGIGLNLDPHWEQTPAALPLAADARLAPASMAELGPVPSMSEMLAALRRYLLEATGLLAAGGWRQLLPHLRERDGLMGRTVTVRAAGVEVTGQAEGIDDDGRLLLATTEGRRSFVSAHVLRVGE